MWWSSAPALCMLLLLLCCCYACLPLAAALQGTAVDAAPLLHAGRHEGAAEAAVQEPEAPGLQQPASQFWGELLQSGYQDLEQAHMAALGKGKRERRHVSPSLRLLSLAHFMHWSVLLQLDPCNYI